MSEHMYLACFMGVVDEMVAVSGYSNVRELLNGLAGKRLWEQLRS